MVRFKNINTELGPTDQQAPKSIVVNMAPGARPPKLIGLVQCYSNYAVTVPKITEEVTIEVANSAGAFASSNIAIHNGDFDNTQLSISMA